MAGIAGSHYWSEYRRNNELAKASIGLQEKMDATRAAAELDCNEYGLKEKVE